VLGGVAFSTTPSPSSFSPSSFFIGASPCLKGLGLALGKLKRGRVLWKMRTGHRNAV